MYKRNFDTVKVLNILTTRVHIREIHTVATGSLCIRFRINDLITIEIFMGETDVEFFLYLLLI